MNSTHLLNRRTARQFGPTVEQLESRCCMNCTFSLPSQKSLVVTGDDGNNTVDVVDDGTTGPGNIQVSCDGTTLTFDNIRSVAVSTLGGNDGVDYRFTQQNMRFVSNRKLRVDLGDGNDGFLLQNDDLILLGRIDARVRGRAGDDQLRMVTGLEIPVGTKGAELKVRLYGDEGTDEVSSAFYIRAGVVDVDVFGGAGDDLLSLNVENSIRGMIDGERGFDTCVPLGGVTTRGCEA